MARQRLEREGRQHRSDLGGEHPLGDVGQLVLACLFFATWVADTFVLKYTTWLNHHVPLAIRISFGVVLLVVSGYLTILFLHHISRYEERLLLARFGEEYAQYMREVPMWVPRLRKKRYVEVSGSGGQNSGR